MATILSTITPLTYQSLGQKDVNESSTPSTYDIRAQEEASASIIEVFKKNQVFDPAEIDNETTHIVSSPYQVSDNLLDLRPLDPQPRLFAIALCQLKPIRDDYATGPYLECFNWSTVFGKLQLLCSRAGVGWQTQDFHVVIFRSTRWQDADAKRIALVDQMSHQEACASGGLLKYWFGSCNAERQNLATCLWARSDDATAGEKGPWHKKARAEARGFYESISFSTHRLVIDAGATSWKLEDHEHAASTRRRRLTR